MLELYHSGVSTCSQKVRLALAEKGLDFTSRAVDLIAGAQHDPAYVKLNPNHVVPTLVHDGTVLIESSLINEYVDDVFPGVALRPEDPATRHAMRLWIKRIDEKVHPNAGTVTFAIGPRALLLQQPKDVREANIEAIPDPKRRAARRSVIEHGVEAPEFQGALDAFLDLLEAMETQLAPGGWLAGDAFSLADASVLPYVMRLDHLAMTPLVSEEQRPRVADWYARVQQRPSFETAVRDWLPEPVVGLFRSGGEAVWPQVEPLTRRD